MSIRYTAEASDALAQDWRENTADTEHTQYVYGRGVYMPDTFTLVRDEDTGRYVFAERYSLDEALSWREEWAAQWLAILDNRDAHKQAAETYRESFVQERRKVRESQTMARNAEALTFRVMHFLGDNARTHATDNSLCENYERFLNNVVRREINNPDTTTELFIDETQTDKYSEFLRSFYVYATRTRRAVLTVGEEAEGYVTGGTVGQESNALVTNQYGYKQTILKSTSVLDYDEAVKANTYAIDNGWTRGHGAFRIDNESESEEENSGRYYCQDCDTYHDNN